MKTAICFCIACAIVAACCFLAYQEGVSFGKAEPAKAVTAAQSQKQDPFMGLLGYPLGTYLTIEGTLAKKSLHLSSASFIVDTVNGAKLSMPVGIAVQNAIIPPDQRCVLRGFETGGFIGIPPEVEKAEGSDEQAYWQFHRHFVATSAVSPEGLEIYRRK